MRAAPALPQAEFGEPRAWFPTPTLSKIQSCLIFTDLCGSKESHQTKQWAILLKPLGIIFSSIFHLYFYLYCTVRGMCWNNPVRSPELRCTRAGTIPCRDSMQSLIPGVLWKSFLLPLWFLFLLAGPVGSVPHPPFLPSLPLLYSLVLKFGIPEPAGSLGKRFTLNLLPDAPQNLMLGPSPWVCPCFSLSQVQSAF